MMFDYARTFVVFRRKIFRTTAEIAKDIIRGSAKYELRVSYACAVWYEYCFKTNFNISHQLSGVKISVKYNFESSITCAIINFIFHQ